MPPWWLRRAIVARLVGNDLHGSDYAIHRVLMVRHSTIERGIRRCPLRVKSAIAGRSMKAE
jgi:hypothetical protein